MHMVSEELPKEFRKSFYLRLFQVISEKTQRRKNFVYNLRDSQYEHNCSYNSYKTG